MSTRAPSSATRLHDPTPRLWGRLTFNPKVWFEPFGSGLLPAMILVLWAFLAGFLPPPVAYAKPAPVDPNFFRNRTRDTVVTSLAGPAKQCIVLRAFVSSVPCSFADLVMFDPATVRDKATFNAPHAYPDGLSCVVVNGTLAWEPGTASITRAGRALGRAKPSRL